MASPSATSLSPTAFTPIVPPLFTAGNTGGSTAPRNGAYRFTLEAGIVTAVFEYDDGIWEPQTVEKGESYVLDLKDSRVVIKSTSKDDGSRLTQRFLASDGSFVFYPLISGTTSAGIMSDNDSDDDENDAGDGDSDGGDGDDSDDGNSDDDDDAQGEDDSGNDDLYRFEFDASDAVVSASKIEDGAWIVMRIDENESFAIDPILGRASVIKTESDSGKIEIEVYNDIDGDGIYVEASDSSNPDDDFYEGGSLADVARGGLGDDDLYGNEGDDDLYGDEGNDDLYGDDDDDDVFGGIGNDELYGGEGNDRLDGELGDDCLNGQIGSDLLNGGEGNDQLKGDLGDDRLNGQVGNDLLDGGDGNDQLNGDLGNDQLQGSAGDDRLNGQLGNDLLAGGEGNDLLSGEAGNDQLTGQLGNDFLDGGEGSDQLNGEAGNDRLNGQLGNDLLTGGEGNDLLQGGADADRLIGGPGVDRYSGGPGADTYRFVSSLDSGIRTQRDVILDFSPGQGDRLDLASMDANASRSGNQAFSWLGTQPFSGAPGQLRFLRTASAGLILQADLNGDRSSDFEISLLNLGSLNSTLISL